MPCRGLRTCGALCIALVMGAARASDKTDVLVLNNGDRITGQIVKLEYGKLQFKTDDIGTLSVEWTAVASLNSRSTFDVEAVNGERHLGTIAGSADGTRLVISAQDRPVELAPTQVTRIAEVERKLWERINGALSFGYDFASSTGIKVLSTHFDATYRAPSVTMSLRTDITSTHSPEEGTFDRARIGFTHQWLRPPQRFWVGSATFERNEELGIEGRLQLGAGRGHYFHQSASSELAGIIGAVVNQEWVTSQQRTQQSIEALISGSWRVFRFDAPETSLTSSATLFPSLTENHRYRANLDLTLRREIIEDFFIDLSVYYDYDNQPPSDDPVKEDYGLTTSLGYSF